MSVKKLTRKVGAIAKSKIGSSSHGAVSFGTRIFSHLHKKMILLTEALAISSKRKSLVVLGILLLLIVVTLTYTTSSPFNTNKSVEERTQEVARDAGKLILLPKDEVPALFEISDPASLIARDTFFVGSEKGDILLIYQKSGKAIIYSKSRNMIVNVGPFVVGK